MRAAFYAGNRTITSGPCEPVAPAADGAHRLLPADLGRSGITESRRIAEMAAAKGVKVVPHLSIALGPQAAAALHFAAGTANCHLSEYNPRVLETANRFLREPLEIDGAEWVTPVKPGLGIELDWDGLAAVL